MEQALTALDGVVRVFAQYQVAAGHALLLGFSQGGAMTYRCECCGRRVFAGLVILGGALPLPTLLPPASRRDQRIFIAHGTHDPVVPVELKRNAVDFLEIKAISRYIV
jgi:phospholipase/carboxylesterase